ncbi:hypothetical protein FKM82_020720 [Ascaphus truei]
MDVIRNSSPAPPQTASAEAIVPDFSGLGDITQQLNQSELAILLNLLQSQTDLSVSQISQLLNVQANPDMQQQLEALNQSINALSVAGRHGLDTESSRDGLEQGPGAQGEVHSMLAVPAEPAHQTPGAGRTPPPGRATGSRAGVTLPRCPRRKRRRRRRTSQLAVLVSSRPRRDPPNLPARRLCRPSRRETPRKPTRRRLRRLSICSPGTPRTGPRQRPAGRGRSTGPPSTPGASPPGLTAPRGPRTPLTLLPTTETQGNVRHRLWGKAGHSPTSRGRPRPTRARGPCSSPGTKTSGLPGSRQGCRRPPHRPPGTRRGEVTAPTCTRRPPSRNTASWGQGQTRPGAPRLRHSARRSAAALLREGGGGEESLTETEYSMRVTIHPCPPPP